VVCIRAESIEQVPEGTTGDNFYDARVESVSFLGAIVTCILRIGGVAVRADLPARRAPAAGQTIRVSVEPEAVTLIPAP
jgi:ABC-type Fe3+/spermidine/putrescine transport system ATPase subunit